jgi:hypothetical protein
LVDRFLDFLYAPLSGRAAKAILILTAAVCHGYVLLTLLSIAAGQDSHPRTERHDSGHSIAPVVSPQPGGEPHAPRPRQDPQDRPGSVAARAARGELRTHRALQHVPYRKAGVTITLIGARHGRALLSVRGGDLSTERQGWQRFLRRFGDDGTAYIPRFAAGHTGASTARVGVAFDRGVDQRVDQRVGVPVGSDSSTTRFIPRHTADGRLPILKRFLRHPEVGT